MHQTRVIVSNRPSLSMSATSLVISAVVAGPSQAATPVSAAQLVDVDLRDFIEVETQIVRGGGDHPQHVTQLLSQGKTLIDVEINYRVAAVEWQHVIPNSFATLSLNSPASPVRPSRRVNQATVVHRGFIACSAYS